MKIEKIEQEYVIRKKITLETIKLNDLDIYAFRHITKTQLPKEVKGEDLVFDAKNKTSKEEGFIDSNNLNKLKNGKQYETLPLFLVSDEQLEIAREEGYEEFCESIDWNSKNKGLFDFIEKKGHKLDTTKLIRIDHSTHMLFDAHENVVPVAVIFDYISSRIDETNYDLDALARGLFQREDIKLLHGDHKLREANKGVKNPKEAIFSIPYYNSEAGRTQSVQFIWKPTNEDYKRVWEVCTADKKKYPSTLIKQVALDKLDIFNIQQYNRENINKIKNKLKFK